MAGIGIGGGIVRNVNLQITATESGQLNVAINGVNQRLAGIRRNAAQIGPVFNQASSQAASAINKIHGPLDRLNRQIKNVFAVAIAFEFIRAFSALENSFAGIIRQGVLYNATLETGRLALAGILASTRQIADASGQVVPVADAYRGVLFRSAELQREIALLNITTLGTQEELEGVAQRVFGFTSRQKATDEERLQLTSNILNTSKLFGLTQDQALQETRQILTLDNERGQTILQNLGYTARQLRAFKDQKTLVQELNRILEGFSAIAGDLGDTWEGLTSTVQTFFNILSSEVFSDVFRGIKDVIDGINQSLKEALASGNLAVSLGRAAEDLVELGRALGDFLISAVQQTARLVRGFIDFSLALGNALAPLRSLSVVFGDYFRGLGEVILGLVRVVGLVESLGEQIRKLDRATKTPITDFFRPFIDFFQSLNVQTQNPITDFFSLILDQAINVQNLLAGVKRSIDDLNFSARDWITLALEAGGVGILAYVLTGGSVGTALLATAFTLIGAIASQIDEIQGKKLDNILGEDLSKQVNSARESFLSLVDSFRLGETTAADLFEEIKKIKETLDAIKADPNLSVLPLERVTAITSRIRALEQTIGGFVGKILQPKDFKPIEEGLDAGQKAAIRFREELAKIQRQLQVINFSAEFNPVAAFKAQLDEIEAARQADLLRAKGNAEALAAVEEIALVKRKLAEISFTDEFIRQLDLRHRVFVERVGNQLANTEAEIDARKNLLEIDQTSLELQLDIAQKRSGTLREQITLINQISDIESQQIQLEIARAQAQINNATQLTKSYQQQIDLLLRYQVFIRSTVQDQVLQAATLKQINDRVTELTQEMDEQGRVISKARDEIDTYTASLQNLTRTGAEEIRERTTEIVRVGDVLVSSLSQVFSSIATGTLKGKQALQSFAASVAGAFATAYAESLKEKFAFDVEFEKNLDGLAGLFGRFGEDISEGFAALFRTLNSGFRALGLDSVSEFSVFFKQGAGDSLRNLPQDVFDATKIAWKDAGSLSGASLAEGFLKKALGTISGGFAGFAAGDFVKDLFGFGGSAEGNLGGQVGGAVGGAIGAFFGVPFLGAFAGNLFGSFIGDFFAHTPTRGTQIRKGVVEFLEEIEATFADEIDSGKYFFKETKKLANQMFGGDGAEEFLKASGVLLREKAGPELARQLLALGTFITSAAAIDKNKSVEQTGTTFGNLLIANLGIDRIPAAIDEIVQKAGISFDDLVTRLNQLRINEEISKEFTGEALLGAIDLFYGDLPDAIGVASIALRNFREDGTLDLEAFNEELEASIQLFQSLVSEIPDFLLTTIRLDKEEFEKELEDFLKDLERSAILTRFFNEAFFTGLFEGIDLSDGIGEEEADQLASRLRIAREELYDILEAAGLLPEELEDSVDTVSDLLDKITELTEKIEELSQKRIDLRINFIQDLNAIGVLGDVDALTRQIRISRRELGNFPLSPIATQPFGSQTDQQLERSIELLGRLADLEVQRYQARVAEIEESLQLEIEGIRGVYDEKRRLIEEEREAIETQRDQLRDRIDQLREERDLVRENFRILIDDLEEQKKSAEELAQKHAEIAEGFERVVESIANIRDALVFSPGSIFTRSAQLANLERELSTLQFQRGRAPLEDQPEILQKIAENVQRQVELLDPSADRAQIVELLRFLEVLQKDADVVAKQQRDEERLARERVEDLTQRIADANVEMEARLKSIDEQIKGYEDQIDGLDNRLKGLDDQLKLIDEQEAAAIKRAQEQAQEQIDLIRGPTADRLQDLYNQLDLAYQEQIRRAEEQRQFEIDSLAKLVGDEEAQRLIRLEQVGHTLLMLETNRLLENIDRGIDDLVNKIQPAQDTYYNPRTSGSHLFLTHPGEYVDIGYPRGRGDQREGVNVSVTINPTIPISLNGSVTAQDGRVAYQSFRKAFLDDRSFVVQLARQIKDELN